MKSIPQQGMTMIELLVAMAIGVTVTLAVSTLLVASENHKRITTSSNDADQTGVYTFNAIDRALRSAGSGFTQSSYAGTNQGVLGCRLNAGSFMPRTSAYPAPFSLYFLGGAAPAALRVAPVLIGAGQSDNNSSDVLVVMGASGGSGGVPRTLYGSGSSTTLVLQSTVGLNPYDLILVSQPGTTDCLVEEINSENSTTLTLNTGTPYYTPGSTTTIGTLSASPTTAITTLANVSVGASPNNTQFILFGVGTNNTLYSYDLLEYQTLVIGFGGDLQGVSDQVIQMNAIYGVSTTANPSVFNNWANPADATHGYDIYTVMNSPTTQKQIVAVRVAIIVRGEYYDKKTVSPTSLTLFSGLVDGYGTSLAKPVNLNVTNADGTKAQNYRYRVFEFTVPLRNMIVLAGGP